MSDEMNPSLFQKSPSDPAAFELTGGFITVTGESRRQQLEIAIGQLLRHYKLDAYLSEKVEYIPDMNNTDGWGYLDSTVKVVMAVSTAIDPKGKVKFEINVPPYLDWGKQVLEIVLNYVAVWAQKIA
jgi:hypothetical protein